MVPTRKMKQDPASFSLSASSSHCLECTEGSKRLDLARKYREGTLTYTDQWDAGAGARRVSLGPDGSRNRKILIWER